MAQRLCDAGHYASNTIRMQAGQLEREWKSLAAAVEDRSVVLEMSVNFYKKAEQVCYCFFIRMLGRGGDPGEVKCCLGVG